MNSDYVKKRIDKIRTLIGEARYDEAFSDLENFIAEVDGEEVEDIRERELLNQLISVKARYSFFKQQVLKGVQDGQVELNQIRVALLSLIDEVKKMGEENPEVFKPADKEKEYYAELAASPTLTATQNVMDTAQDGSQNSGCLLAINNKNANVNVEIKNFNWFSFLLKAALIFAILSVAVFFFLKGCNESPPPTPPVTKEDPDRKGEGEGGELQKQVVRGLNCKELGISKGSICDLADYISDSDNSLSKKFEMTDLSFNKNSLRLSDRSKANEQINDLVKLLNAYPDLGITIYGFTSDGEDDVIKGVNGKEDGLDNVRAKKVFSLLKKKGISSKRMDHIGDTENDLGNRNIWIKME